MYKLDRRKTQCRSFEADCVVTMVTWPQPFILGALGEKTRPPFFGEKQHECVADIRVFQCCLLSANCSFRLEQTVNLRIQQSEERRLKKAGDEQTLAVQGSYFGGVVSAVIPTVTRPGRRGGEEEAGSSASALSLCQDATVSPPAEPQGRVSLGRCR